MTKLHLSPWVVGALLAVLPASALADDIDDLLDDTAVLMTHRDR